MYDATVHAQNHYSFKKLKRLYLYPNLYTVVLILVIHYMNKTTSLLQYTTITPRLPAGSRSYLQYTTIHHGYQPKLSTVYYSILQYTTATSRSYLQYTTVYYNASRLPAEVIYSILQYTTATSRSYL